MHLGIDLGTSNSAIVGNDKGALRLFKTAAKDKDVLPSVVLIDRRGHMMVGERAYDNAIYAPDDVAQGFKRLLGTSSLLTFASSQKTMTPEEASSEVLKTLLAQARMAAGDFETEGVVITIPAAFNQMQSEGTMKAAALAGFETIGLLQEPVAAAMAAVANLPNKSGQFLIYDLGGGTFDVAIVQSIGGAVNVVAHAGVNMLGGRDFDRAIVNGVVRPWLSETFDLAPNFQAEPDGRKILRIAQHSAEMAKISLSLQTSDRIFADAHQIGVKDRQGQDIYLDIELTRPRFEGLIQHHIDRSIDLCRKTMADNGYQAGDIDFIVLIGGPSRMPIVRSLISRELGVPVDLTVDPMTAVALGAAIYAEGRDWSASASVAKPSRAASRAEGPLDIRYDYPARTSDDRMRIRIRPGANVAGRGYRVQIDGADGWTSAQIALEGDVSINDVPISFKGENHYRITVFDPSGSPAPEAGLRFVVLKTAANAAGVPATQTLAVKIVEGAFGAERNVLLKLIEKGTLLPVDGSTSFRAARGLRAGDGSHIDFELYQHVEGVNDPDLNLHVGALRIDSSDFERGEVIRRGDEIVCAWSMDDNGILNCSFEIPAISRICEGGKMYVDVVGHKNFEGEEGLQIASSILNDAKKDLKTLREVLGPDARAEADGVDEQIERQTHALKDAWDADAKRAVAEEGRLIRQNIARIKNKPLNAARALKVEIKSFERYYDAAIRAESDAKLNDNVDRLCALALDTLKRTTPDAIADARRSLDEAIILTRADVFKRPKFMAKMFNTFASQKHFAIDKALHDRLVDEGASAIERGDIVEVHSVIYQIRENFLKTEVDSQASALSGLMRW